MFSPKICLYSKPAKSVPPAPRLSLVAIEEMMSQVGRGPSWLMYSVNSSQGRYPSAFSRLHAGSKVMSIGRVLDRTNIR